MSNSVDNKSKQKQKQQPKKINSGVAPVSYTDEICNYAAALMDPFSMEATGARIPDISNSGTITGKAMGIVTLSSNAAGVCSFTVSSNPLYSVVDMTGASVNASSSMGNLGAQSPNIYGAANQGNLQALMSNARVVGWGFRFRNQLPPTAAVGRFLWACVPTSGDAPGYNTTIAQGAPNSYIVFRQTGLLYGTTTGTTSGIPASIVSYPHSGEFSIQDCIGQAMEFVGTISDYKFCDFHTTNSIANAGSGFQNGTSITTVIAGATIASVDNLDVTDYRGWNQYLIRIEGLPASTVIGELDYIYHLEGGQSAPTSSLGVIEPDSEIKTHVNTAALHKLVDISVMSKAVHFVDQVFAGDYFKAGSTLIGKKNTRKLKEFTNRQIVNKLGLVL